MAILNRDYALFTPRFATGLLRRGAAGANCEVSIYTTALTDGGGTNPTETKTVAYAGVARLQPLRSTLSKDTPGSQSMIHSIQFQLPLTTAVKSTVFAPAMLVKVTTCDLLPAAVGWTGVLKGVPDAPNAVERTLVAELDTAGRP
ncbi:MAG: DUF6093 family protein [Candidatus Paceibacterota bacterium]